MSTSNGHKPSEDLGQSFDKITAALRGRGSHVKTTGDRKAVAQCPAHDDGNPSLSLTWSGGKNPLTLIHCFAGCETKDITAALGLRISDLYDKDRTVTYTYTNPDSGWAERFVHRNPETKEFTQSIKKKTDKTPLYRRDLLRKARAEQTPVILVEGEKDADTLIYAGYIATTAPQGAKHFGLADVSELAGLNITAIADKPTKPGDKSGNEWARQVYHHAGSVAGSITFKYAAVGKDVSDHIAAQLPITDLIDPPQGFPYESDEPQGDPSSNRRYHPQQKRRQQTPTPTNEKPSRSPTSPTQPHGSETNSAPANYPGCSSAKAN